LSKRGRHLYLKRLILGVQTITGMLSGTMTKAQGYQFLVMGRNLERADMTTRIIDVRSADLIEDSPDLRPFHTIQWVSVLRSLTAYQMYRQSRQPRVRRSEVLRFLFQDPDFPRSVFHCVSSVELGASKLPRNEGVLRHCGRLKRTWRMRMWAHCARTSCMSLSMPVSSTSPNCTTRSRRPGSDTRARSSSLKRVDAGSDRHQPVRASRATLINSTWPVTQLDKHHDGADNEYHRRNQRRHRQTARAIGNHPGEQRPDDLSQTK
jgi:hypothetical protein